jgi:hypothetical protein
VFQLETQLDIACFGRFIQPLSTCRQIGSLLCQGLSWVRAAFARRQSLPAGCHRLPAFVRGLYSPLGALYPHSIQSFPLEYNKFLQDGMPDVKKISFFPFIF